MFLDSAGNVPYFDYPKPLLGDFGFAFRTNPTDPHNPQWYNRGDGTRGFKAPEQSRWVDSNTQAAINVWPLLAATNVYGIGVTLRSLVALNREPRQPFWLGNGAQDQTLMLQTPGVYPVDQYSQQLKNLINLCLSFNFAQRPTFDQILNTVRFNTNENPGFPNLARNMRSGNAPVWLRNALMPAITPDNYQVGFARATLPQEL